MLISTKADSTDLLRKLQRYDYITFDIFDTLIKRNVASPDEVFHLIERAYNKTHNIKISNFYEKRKEAEKEARRKSKYKEITLDEIYAKISYKQPINGDLKRLEIEMEKHLCVPNPTLVPVFQELVEGGKQVYIISDMYLSRETVASILSKCGIYGYKKLYLSSEYRCSKRKGLFSIFLHEEDIKKQRIIHVGDGLRSDLLSPICQRGVHYHAILIPRIQNAIPYKIGEKGSSVSSDILNSFISNHLSRQNDYFYRMGYAVYGPVLYGFADWIMKNIQDNGVQKVLFLARDCYVVKNAFDLLYKDVCQNFYFYLSRRSILGIRLQGDYSLENVLDKIHMRVGTTVEALLRHMDAYTSENIHLAQSMGISLDLPVHKDKLDDRMLSFFKIVNEKQKDCYQEKAILFKEYLSQFISTGERVAIVDVGWNGTAQQAVKIAQSELKLDARIEGYYLGLNKEKSGREKNIVAKGYLVDEKTPEEKRIRMKAYMGFLEFFLSAPHGMTTGYVKKNDGVFPILQDYEYVFPDGLPMKEIHILKELHEGALQFVSEFSASGMADFIDWNADEIVAPIFRLCTDAEQEDLVSFGNIRFFDTDLCPMARPQSLHRYLFHPKDLKRDFAKSTWKPGFMKRLLGGMMFPYYSVYKILIKRFNK